MTGSEAKRGAATDDGPAFEEHQSMPSWFGPALVAVSVPTLLLTVVVIVSPEGMTAESVAISALLAVLVLGPIPLLARATLRTTVREGHIAFRLAPFHRSERTIRSERSRKFDRASVVPTSTEFAERGGVEYRPNANEGIECYRENGPPIVLGSDRPSDL